MLKILRRFLFLLSITLLPLYAWSLTEQLEVPPQWRDIAVGDTHADVRGKLRASGLADQQCEWFGAKGVVRCTIVGLHHAAGVAIAFDRIGSNAQVAEVRIHEPVYTGPFHLHVRLKRGIR